MKIYCYNDPVFDKKGNLAGNKIVEVSAEKILSESYGWRLHCDQMCERKGILKLTDKECIEEWQIMNWAWEKNDENI